MLPFRQTPLSRHVLVCAWILFAALPVVYITLQVLAANRNIAFQDEFDTAIALLLRLDAGAGWRETVDRLFALSNEHRTVTSRLIFAASYWLTGTVNFNVIGAIGNAFILVACLILIGAARTTERRIRLAVVLAFLTFHLGNFENFLWSGASIDHFQIVMLAVGAFVLLTRDTRGATVAAGGLAALATFTLAHGCLVWLLGGGLLWQQRRQRWLVIWTIAAAVTMFGFFDGFQVNPGHHIASFSFASMARIFVYWLALLGAPLALGDVRIAPIFGVILLAALAFMVRRGAASNERISVVSALFAILSLALVAYGRADMADGQIASRYMVLGVLAWSMLVFLGLERWTNPARPYRLMWWCVPGLLVFNVSTNAKFAPKAFDFVEARDRAALRFKQYGVDGRGQTRLYPQDGYADALLTEAAARGIYSLPVLCFETTFPEDAQRSDRIVGYVDENMITAQAVSLGGWAMLPEHTSERGEIHAVLRSAGRTLMFTTITVQRPDVAAAYKEPRWRLGGFRFVVLLSRLPVDDYQVGLLIDDGGESEFVMTDQWVRLAHPTPGPPTRFNTL